MSDELRRLQALVEAPRILLLWDALQPLRTTVRLLQTGAHPDDETSALLARLARADGVAVAYACATRGEGGQNAIGTEAGATLAVLRTREMELAAARIPMRLYWLNPAGGPIVDFGFAKTAERSFAVWGRERLVDALVRVIRHFRPDVVLPTFLDVEGQHGHHRAVTQATEEAFERAADPFHDSGLEPWTAAKLYLPAWSGAGRSYDDTESPPPATVTVEVGAIDPVRGASYAQLGQWSRAAHRCQGMGRWLDPAPEQVPLHRRRCRIDAPDPEPTLFAGLFRTLGEWAGVAGPGPLRTALQEAQGAIDDALAAFPDSRKVLRAVHQAVVAAERASTTLTTGAPTVDPQAAAILADRLQVKKAEMGRVGLVAAGLGVRLEAETGTVVAGRAAGISATVVAGEGGAEAVGLALEAPEGWWVEELAAATGTGATGMVTRHAWRATPPAGSEPLGPMFDPALPEGPIRARVSHRAGGVELSATVGLERRLTVLPAVTVTAHPQKLALPLANAARALTLELELRPVASGTPPVELSLGLPTGWRARPDHARLALDAQGGGAMTTAIDLPAGVGAGRHRIGITVDGEAATTVTRIDHPHIEPSWHLAPAAVEVLLLDLRLPVGVRIGYVEGGSDRVADWLDQLGLEVIRLDAGTLLRGDLDGLQTIMIGVQAFRTRPDLLAATPHLRAWVEAGGNLVTQYHRPWDNWDPDTTPPRPLAIGEPSVRFRVTHPDAPVTVLQPDHPLLQRPNRIGAADWTGWDKERGLYFASHWDSFYTPVLAMADPGEPPLEGALLSANIGRGRHTHLALTLHHQLDHLVPGAFRLLANLLTPADRSSESTALPRRSVSDRAGARPWPPVALLEPRRGLP